PDLPDGALWMWAAVGLSIPFSPVNFQQTFVPLIVMAAVPCPAGAPFGTSTPPVILTVSVVPAVAPSTAAGTATAATAAMIAPIVTRRRPTIALLTPVVR